jgi:hypothetical protein
MNMLDPNHSEAEQCFLVLGMSSRRRLVVVSYAERPPRTRIISARVAATAILTTLLTAATPIVPIALRSVLRGALTR